ncbi:MAG: hypothetical protein HOK49_16025 [Opitutae bacterium]|nr:hypothetical protein [Opitutae bacterium]
MDFAATICFLVLYYIRPYEHTWGLLYQLVGWMKPIQMVTVVGIVSMFRRPLGIKKSDFLQTPHDWFMLILFTHIVLTAGEFDRIKYAFNSLLPVFVFYILIVQALGNLERLEKFLTVWITMILVLASLSLLSLSGFDPTGGRDIVDGMMKGRLIFNTSIFNNPNALGHSVVPAIPLVYFLLIWQRPVFVKIPAIFLILLPAFCVFQTQSKGAFLAGGVTLLFSMLFKRHWVLQATMLMLTFGVGITLIQKLPRMNEFSKSEGGIQGRQIAMEFGYDLTTVQAKWTGVGYKKYRETMQEQLDGIGIANHGSYNEIGTNAGQIGLFLYLGLLYLSMRVLLLAKPRSIREDRVQRLLFIFVVSFAISAWVIDWAYRATYFFTAATVASFHRLMIKSRERDLSVDNEDGQILEEEDIPEEQQALSMGPMPSSYPTGTKSKQEEQSTGYGIQWKRVGFFDMIMMTSILYLCLYIWKLMIESEF